jgi:hypothetical protein
MSSRMSYLTVAIVLAGLLGGATARAQVPANKYVEAGVYCSGVVTTQAPSPDIYVISGPESEVKSIFGEGNFIFINKGSSQGVKVGDEFLALRPESEQLEVPWFTGQVVLTKAMGTYYPDLGRVKVVTVQANTSVAEVTQVCGYLQRGDLLEPFKERQVPTVKAAAAIDRFAPPNGKAKASVVFTKNFGQTGGNGTVVYLNLGSAQGVKVGDYFRLFHYQSDKRESLYSYKDTAYRLWGFGSAPVPYTSKDLPRDVVGEAVVLRVGPNASSVMLINMLRDVFVGDYAEIE